MEGVAAEATPPAEGGGPHEDCAAIFPPVSQRGQPPEPSAPPRAHQDGHEASDATESADSEDEADPPLGAWELRRSSSSSVHSGEDVDAEALETKQFMKAYVEKVFHGR